ncbi:sulfotransferase family 2 domain-containing protein [Leisingera sp. JC1]|uniref:sulfotransferase family 2 domain-containing protein n=1 Tax=Leisingera sp. JC1 TaxID=1855282 RepID=UPI000803A011|nr:sulfotransferase family 2 domain-containing protein [Leisingera sp. JC1]OBY28845.1 hypothetical protein A9D60_01550 [Leisingera sp. JC1]
MPLFRSNGEIHFFAHVPKCAGQSIESYLEARFGSLAFLDNHYYALPPEKRWNRSSPQHVTKQALGLVVPKDWISSSFACVRNPYDRIVSAYNFASTINRQIPAHEDIVGWFLRNDPRKPGNDFQYDNHLRTADDLVPEDATVFRMEDGLESVIPHLDQLEGCEGGSREIAHINQAKQSVSSEEFEKRPLPDRFIEIAAEFYAKDFERFGYSTADIPQANILVPKRDLIPVNTRPTAFQRLKRKLRRKFLFQDPS